MKKKILITLGVGVVTIIVLVFGLSSTTNSPAPDQSNTGQTQQSNAPAEITITYTDAGFASDSYEIASGGTVTVENNSSQTLELSSDNHPSHTKNPELNMSALDPGETGTFTPQRSGEWGFHNHLLHTHTGQLTVR